MAKAVEPVQDIRIVYRVVGNAEGAVDPNALADKLAYDYPEHKLFKADVFPIQENNVFSGFRVVLILVKDNPA